MTPTFRCPSCDTYALEMHCFFCGGVCQPARQPMVRNPCRFHPGDRARTVRFLKGAA